MSAIDHKVCELAIEKCEPRPFEQFVQAFHAALVGANFVPLGGYHDGGADGFNDPVYLSEARAGVFLQASKTADLRGKILAKIIEALPTATQFVRGVIDDRLEELSSKGNPSGRRISWHKSTGQYGLRHEDRKRFIGDNIEDAALYGRISDSLRLSFRASIDQSLHRYADLAVAACHRVLQLIFETQGLALSMYAIGEDDDAGTEIDARKIIEEQATELPGFTKHQQELKEWLADRIRTLIYGNDDDGKRYLDRLSRTYFLLFILKNDPKIIEFFNSMASQLVLYVGSDLIIKALSEYYLQKNSQLTIRTLGIIKSYGATLIVTETAMDEVYTHLKAVDLEFCNHYAEIEPIVDANLAAHIDRILIRAYFYSRLGLNTGGRKPAGWKSFLGQFCDYATLQRDSSRDGLRMYICEQFKMEYEPEEVTLRNMDLDELEALKTSILNVKQLKRRAEVLARNDAIHVLRVFSRRRQIHEHSVANPFGYRTWWGNP